MDEEEEEDMEIGETEMAIRAVQEETREQDWGDLSGKIQIPELVQTARMEELGELAKHRVYERQQ